MLACGTLGGSVDRRFVLPTLSAIALSATSGCSSDKALIGEWTMSSWVYDGVLYRFPREYTYVEGGVTYTYRSGGILLIQEEGRAAFGGYYEYTSSEGDFYHEEYLYTGDWERTERRTWAISIDEFELDMDCTLGDEDLDCVGDMYGDEILMSLVKSEDA